MTDIFAGEPTPHDAGGLPDALPLLPLRETVLFPHAILPLAAGRPASLRLIEEAARGNRRIGVVTQRDATAEEPQAADLYRVGVVATIHKVAKQPDGTLRLVVQGVQRFRVVELIETKPTLPPKVRSWNELLSDEDLLATLPRVASVSHQVEVQLAEGVTAARARGITWTRIGGALGMTRQSAWERFSGEE